MNKKLKLMASAIFVASAAFAATPSYPGGEDAMNTYISNNLNYPQRALDNGIEGIVIVTVSIDANGNMTSAKVCNSIDPDLEQEALRIVKSMTGWIAPIENGIPVPSSTNITVIFNLPLKE